MQFERLALPEVVLITPRVFADERGFFYESFQQKLFDAFVGPTTFVQDNHSKSSKGVLRGLHYQLDPFSQGKLVRVTHGAIFDVAVDIRPHSPTFGHHVSAILSGANRQQLYIPAGFAHGFLSLEDNTEVLYKATNYYSAAHDRSILWSDPALNIAWPLQGIGAPELSKKDIAAPCLSRVCAQ